MRTAPPPALLHYTPTPFSELWRFMATVCFGAGTAKALLQCKGVEFDEDTLTDKDSYRLCNDADIAIKVRTAMKLFAYNPSLPVDKIIDQTDEQVRYSCT